FEIDELIRKQDLKGLILKTAEIIASGYDLNEFLLGFEEHLRNILVTRTLGTTDLLETSDAYLQRYTEVSARYSESDLLAYLQIIGETINTVKNSQQPQLKFELGLIRLAKMPSTAEVSSILEKIDLLKKKASIPVVYDAGDNGYDDGNPGQETSTNVLNKEYFVQKWPAIVKAIHDKRPSLAVIFEKAEITSFADNKLCILLSEVDSFQKDLLHSAKSLIEKVLRTESDEQIAIVLKYNMVKETAKPQKKNRVDKQVRVQKLLKQEPDLARIIDEFDLDLME
ncbi:MAG TPA: hypothetical protein EYP36_10105, partial [Calditrichaeota bacterium]|nr:hypothetical protein [Calditrichota bacterium]